MRSIEVEYNKLLKEAQKQPGVVEVAKVYGQYDNLLKQTRKYLSNPALIEDVSVSTSTESKN